MLYTATTFKMVFDYQPDDIYWCTADIGWITGHSYITYGPLANGATSVLVSCELFRNSDGEPLVLLRDTGQLVYPSIMDERWG